MTRQHYASLLTLLSATAVWAGPEFFPIVGGSQQQTVTIRIIALGTKETWCTAALGFRSLSGEPIGSTKEVALRIGQSERLTFRLADLGLADGERAELRPVVELGASLSVCWPAVEVTTPFTSGVAGYVSGIALRMKRPADARLSPFVETRDGETVRVIVYRVDRDDAPACELRAGFRGADGTSIGEEETWSLAPGESKRMDYAPSGKERVLITLRPLTEDGASGCVASTQLYDRRTGGTVKVVPMALPRTTALLDVPPPADAPEESHPEEPPSSARPIGQVVEIPTPLGLPPVASPEDNPPTWETIALGRRLFYDTVLSADGTIACASCHDPAAGFSDPRRLSLGVNGAEGDRNSMTVLNAALSAEVFWEGRSKGLEAQARMPVTGAAEFAHSLQGVERRLKSDPAYVRWFEEAWGPAPITYYMAAKSIATFQRTLLSGNSPFDQFMFGGNRNALSQSAQRALFGFGGVPGCNQCHLIGTRSATLGSDKFFNTGVAAITRNTLKDQGRWKVTEQEMDRGAFRPPTLRNIELTAPYMHDGNFGSISEVAFFYAGGGRDNDWLSPLFRSIGRAPGGSVPPQDLDDINVFIRALTGEMPENAGPPDQ